MQLVVPMAVNAAVKIEMVNCITIAIDNSIILGV